MQVHNFVAIVLPPAMAFSYMLYEVFLADKISPLLWIAEEADHRCHWLRFPGSLSERCTNTR